ncbi:phenylacetate--CoA ligase family protein [Halobacterium litoreum]|uniref:Phenylacetate--CoA ligase family protein n=1 Tax=Halobacterium litoreum TaxID=2039234 RepID=A0ABD5NCR6_9EURY|nr:phenylacetate--CoA ligase family protein [Halobacterium litoreum]UHH14047.1 phenylacetate--CoA ligase family protein [Halobacterium litoreum]
MARHAHGDANGASRLDRARLTVDVWRAKWADADAIAARRRRRLRDLLSFARRQSRFYRRHYADVPEGTTDLERFPPVTKPTLMANFDDVVTDTAVTRERVDAFLADDANVGRRLLGRYPVWTTSGTTGEPGVFLQDDAALHLVQVVPDRWIADAVLGLTPLYRILANDARGAEVAVAGGHFAGASGVALLARESRFLRDRLRLFSPTRPLDELVAAVDEFQPAFLVGYATVLLELARAQRDGRLDVSPALVSPTAEPITDAGKRELAAAFDCAVREVYAATECGFVAVECARGNRHVNTDWAILEPVDEQYERVPAGESSHTVLLTNLANRIQPIIRYDLGDSVTVHPDPCPCGSAFPAIDVEGRAGDVLRFQTADGDVPVFPLALSTVVEEVPGVRRAQIVRTAADALRVHIETAGDRTGDDVWTQVESDLQSFLAARGVTDVRVERAATPPQRDERSGKFRHVRSEID